MQNCTNKYYSELINFIREWYRTDGFIALHEPRFKEIDKQYVLDVIESTFVSSSGEYIDRFEQMLARYLGVNHAIATVNGTAALQVALKLTGVKSGDEVITQPLTFVATTNAIVYNNATPLFIDVDRETLGLSPQSIEKFLDQNVEKKGNETFNKTSGQRIAAIVPMHTFGHPCKMKQIIDLSEYWNIPVVEDAAEAFGSKIANQYCAGFGKLGVLSFNGNKTITCGGGGAIITNDKALAKKARHLITTAKVAHSWDFTHDEIGFNFRLPNLNAALACAQLEQIDEKLKDKRELARSYESFLKKESLGTFLKEPDGCTSNYWLNGVITPDKKQRDRLLKITNEEKIMTRPIWQLISDLPMYKNCQKGDLVNARWLQDRVVNLPSSVRIDV